MKPEHYWIKRGQDVIGLDVADDVEGTRQSMTYHTLATVIRSSGCDVVLDIGCNSAVLALYLDTVNYYGGYVGLDSNPYALALASVIAPVIQGNLRALPFPAQSFDAVVVKDVIEHLESFTLLAEAFRVARRLVILAVYLPFEDGPEVITRHADGYYTNVYSFYEVIAYALTQGFTLRAVEHTREANGTDNQITVWERIEGNS